MGCTDGNTYTVGILYIKFCQNLSEESKRCTWKFIGP